MARLGLLHPLTSEVSVLEMNSREFFARLPAVKVFQELFDSKSFSPVPDDWAVVLTDVQGSTVAISEGRYKDVNLVGASTIMAVLNACKDIEIPYVFGGDGATLMIPIDHQRVWRDFWKPSLISCRVNIVARR